MKFNKHTELRANNKHAIFSPSQYRWLRYDLPKLHEFVVSNDAKKKGLKMHDFAAEAIELGIHTSGNDRYLDMYIRDAIHHNMQPEVTLYANPWVFGTADAISYIPGLLRISDLKTGAKDTSLDQLVVYAALFFIEYGIDYRSCRIVLRIYQKQDGKMNGYKELENPHPHVKNAILQIEKIGETMKEW